MAQISIVRKSQLEGAMRLDAEYYQPKYLKVSKQLRECGAVLLGELLSDIRYGIYTEPDYLEKGTDFIRALNLEELVIEGDVLKIKPSAVPNEKYLMRSGDVLIVRSGANVGNSGIVVDKFVGATFGSYTIRLRFKPSINPYVCYIFLKSKFGRLQTVRFRTGLAQPNINIPNLKQLQIVSRFPMTAQQNIENLVKQSHQEVFRSTSLYLQAEQLLLDEIGFKDLDLSHQLYWTVPFKKTKEADRLDAEHFQPKYDRVVEFIKRLQHTTLRDLGKVLRGRNPSRYAEEGIPVIRAIDLRNILDTTVFLRCPPEKGLFYLHRGDILISSIGWGSIGKVATFVHPERMATVSEVSVIRQTEMEPFALQIFLQSPLGQLQLERWITGSTGQLHLYPRDIETVVVPYLVSSLQQRIADLVTQSWEARQKARRLLEEAKSKVESLIEGRA